MKLADVTSSLPLPPGRWRDWSLSGLLLVQVVTTFGLVPAAAAGMQLPPAVAALVLLAAMSLTASLARGGVAVTAGAAMILMALTSAAAQAFGSGPATRMLGNSASLLAFALLDVVVFQAVFGPGQVNWHRIRGAVVLYLNTGLMFAFAHRIVAGAVPDAYDHLPPDRDAAAFIAAIDYFSFTTLTTVGYGDIQPVHPIARSLSTLEATLGEVLPTVLIARVVSLAIKG